MEENKIEINDIMKITQMPVVFEQLERIGTLIEEKTKDLDKLECTEENKQEVKKRRTEINKTLEILESRRKEIKTKLLEPYNVFNEKYENECKTKLENASNLLKGKIDYIEQQQLSEKEDELREFAKQHIEANNLQDVIAFEDIDLNITLSSSIKSLKEQVLDFISAVSKDIQCINSDENRDELLYEYLHNGYNYSNSVLAFRKKQEELNKLKELQKQQLEEENQFKKVAEKVVEIITAPKEVFEDDEIIEVQFKVKATKDKILKLKEYLKENEIAYE